MSEAATITRIEKLGVPLRGGYCAFEAGELVKIDPMPGNEFRVERVTWKNGLDLMNVLVGVPSRLLVFEACAEDSVSEFQREVSKWASETFPHQTPHSKMAHLRKEIEELGADLGDGEEMADCFILLLNLAEMAGVDLMRAAKRKMEINRKRTWGAPDADGVCHHVKQIIPLDGVLEPLPCP
jgi:NTP pyrophosphatase (non-canonical NTP hydrolase)